jgi:hypothetical protein
LKLEGHLSFVRRVERTAEIIFSHPEDTFG